MLEKTKPAVTVTGELRSFLSECALEVKSGTLDTHRAGAIVKLAAQINANFAAETEAMRLLLQLERQVPDIGHLPIKYE